MKKLCVFLASVVFVGINFLQAQNVQITGTVTSAEDGEPLIGATIQAKGTGIGVATDFDGKYSISVPASATVLEVRSIGMKMQDVQIGGRTIINVVLEPDMEELEEVVVVGYGSAKKVGTVVGSVAQVSGEKIASRPQSSVIDAIQGQVSGLQVYSSTGEPGTNQSIRLHGIGSLGASSSPLFVLDGVAVSSAAFQALNPNDIETVNVLKDASATSIYGSRAANGVVYITTKRGSSSRSQIEVRSHYGVSSMADTRFYDRMMTTDQLFDFWKETGVRTEAQIAQIQTGLERSGMLQPDGSFHNTDWRKYMQPDNRPTYQGDISIMGGAKATQYRVSASVYHEDGTAPSSSYDRYTFGSNIDSRVNDWMKFGANLRLSKSTRADTWTYHSNNTYGGLSYMIPPFYSYETDVDGNKVDYIASSQMWDPLLVARSQIEYYNNYGALLTGYIELEPITNLKIRSTPGLDALGRVYDFNRLPSTIFLKGNGATWHDTYRDYTATITNTIEYSLELKEKNNFTFLIGHEGLKNDYHMYRARISGLKDDRLILLQHGDPDTRVMQEAATTSLFNSFFGRAEYNYDRKYFVDASIRQDESSRFGRENRDAFFWAVGAMWKMKSEEFLKDVDLINDMNFKVSYGTQGNAGIGDFTAFKTIAATTKYANHDAWILNNAGNDFLTWEKQSKLTVGLSTRFLNRFNLNVEYYNRSTHAMLMSVPVPYSTGYEEMMENVGTLTNNGVDILLNVDILTGHDYYLGVSTVFNYNSEKVTALFDGRERYQIPNTGVAWVVGEPVMYYYPIYAGVNPDNGNMQWYLPGDNIDVTTMDKDRVTETFNDESLTQNTGIRRYPPMTGGFGLSGSWRGIGLNRLCIFIG